MQNQSEDQHLEAERWPVEIVIDQTPRCEGLTGPSNVMGTLHVLISGNGHTSSIGHDICDL